MSLLIVIASARRVQGWGAMLQHLKIDTVRDGTGRDKARWHGVE